MKLLVNGKEHFFEPSSSQKIEITKLADRFIVHAKQGSFSALAIRSGNKVLVSCQGKTYCIEQPTKQTRRQQDNSSQEFHAPMPGQVVDIMVKQGEIVSKNQKLAILEAMKTQIPILAPFDAQITHLPVKVGNQVKEGDLIIQWEPVA